MTIEKIACPRLNKESGSNSINIREVFVKFVGEQPSFVMCDLYNPSSKKCNILYNANCIYSEWKNFK